MNRDQMAKAFSLLHRPGKAVEVRMIYGDQQRPWTGTFSRYDEMVSWVEAGCEDENLARIQWSLNGIRPDWPVNNVLARGASALSKTDIVSREWVFIDCDLKTKPGLTPSSLDEHDTLPLTRYLESFGIGHPVVISSGRGLNLLFKAGWGIADESVDFHAVAKGLAAKFADEERFVVDDATSPERGAKIPGITVLKDGRPRPVELLGIIVSSECVEKVLMDGTPDPVPQERWASLLDDLPPVARIRSQGARGNGAEMDEDFDIYDFCEFYGIEILAEHGDRFDIACPLKGERHAGGASVTAFFYDGDRLGFKCLHPDHESVTIGKLLSELQSECGRYEAPLFAERESGIDVEDVGDDFMSEEKPWRE